MKHSLPSRHCERSEAISCDITFSRHKPPWQSVLSGIRRISPRTAGLRLPHLFFINGLKMIFPIFLVQLIVPNHQGLAHNAKISIHYM
jgi:hypothetical protein